MNLIEIKVKTLTAKAKHDLTGGFATQTPVLFFPSSLLYFLLGKSQHGHPFWVFSIQNQLSIWLRHVRPRSLVIMPVLA